MLLNFIGRAKVERTKTKNDKPTSESDQQVFPGWGDSALQEFNDKSNPTAKRGWNGDFLTVSARGSYSTVQVIVKQTGFFGQYNESRICIAPNADILSPSSDDGTIQATLAGSIDIADAEVPTLEIRVPVVLGIHKAWLAPLSRFVVGVLRKGRTLGRRQEMDKNN